jgi:NDP-sugar pyrophosphorylase family protein
MLSFNGKPLVEHQVSAFRRTGIEDIVIIRRHLKERIQVPGVQYVDSTATNMVADFLSAQEHFTDDVVMSYGDVLVEDNVLRSVAQARGDVSVLVDQDWKEYWNARFGDWHLDSESLVLNGTAITSLGKPNPQDNEMDARYVGVIKFSKDAWPRILAAYDAAKRRVGNGPWHASKSINTGYMTDFMQELIDQRLKVHATIVKRGWLEFDTVSDYEKALQWQREKTLDRFYRTQL